MIIFVNSLFHSYSFLFKLFFIIRAGLKQIVEQAVGVQGGGASKLSEFITSGGTSSKK